MKKTIKNLMEQFALFIVLIGFTIAFFRTESYVLHVLGLFTFVLSVRTFMVILDNGISLYIDIKFINKNYRK